MIQSSGHEQQKKPAASFKDRGWLVEGVVLFLGLQHLDFKLRRPALLVKEVAEGKGEVEKCTSAIHNLGYYRPHQNGCQELLSLGFLCGPLRTLCALCVGSYF
jgi:hypothetical protein